MFLNTKRWINQQIRRHLYSSYSKMSRRYSSEGSLFVGRLSKSCRVRDLEDVFEPYGRMSRCEIKYGRLQTWSHLLKSSRVRSSGCDPCVFEIYLQVVQCLRDYICIDCPVVTLYFLFRVYLQVHARPFTESLWLDLPL